jgi:hypothetical protein
MHADLAAEEYAGIGLAYDFDRRPLGRVLAQAVADRGGASRERQKPASIGNQLAVGGGVGDLCWIRVLLIDGAEYAQRDQIPISRRVRDVARRRKRGSTEAVRHPRQIGRGLRQHTPPG